MAGSRDPNQVVQQIQGFLRSNNQELTQDLRELAREHADWGRHAADRMRRCEEFMQRGLRSEAVHHARLDPPLLQLAGSLQFQQQSQWDEIITLYGLPVSPLNAVVLESMAALNQAFAEEEILAHEMRQYRRLVLEQADSQTRAEKLRTMLMLEPDHQGLQDNLRDVEGLQVQEILEQIRRADRAGKPNEVGRLYQGMQTTPWANPPAGVVVDEIHRIFRKHHSKYIDEMVNQLSTRIVEAHGRMDTPVLTRLLVEWDNLAPQAGLMPGDRRARPVESARLWANRASAEQEMLMQHQMALAELASALGTEKDTNRLFTLYERVYSFKGRLPKGTTLIPPELEHRFDDATNKLEKTAQFNRLLILVATISLGVVALVGFLVFVMTR